MPSRNAHREVTLARATKLIEKAGILLVFPRAVTSKSTRAAPVPSLWDALYPNVPMRWEWDETADPRVVELWHLRERLAHSRDVVYAKWFQGRATFFSLGVFRALLADLHAGERAQNATRLPAEAREILDLLLDNSPQSTKAIREAAGLRGKPSERIFHNAMKALWSQLLVVGVGEVDDGAFPSLAVAATETWFEDAWQAREAIDTEDSARLGEAIERAPAFARELARSRNAVKGTRE